MARAAVPAYVGQDFSACPPGHRFNLYFRVWTDQWKKEETSTAALRDVLCLPANARALLDALIERQLQMAQAIPAEQLCVIDAQATSPFATGLGLEHPIENGFAFLAPYGLPYLAGSAVKGVLRRAAEELCADGELDFDPALIDALFGPEDTLAARRGTLTCWDVLPQFDAMTLDIMTPHQSGYYQGNESPHDAGKPTPIPFLALPAGAKFRFVLRFEPSLVPAASRAALADWQAVALRIARHAFDWLGFGAKTAVGYGAMALDRQAAAQRAAEVESVRRKRAEQAKRAARVAEIDAMEPVQREIEQFFDQRLDKNQGKRSVYFNALKKGEFSGEVKRAAAERVRRLMQAEKCWKEQSTKKNPDKDHDYQDTLLVKKWLSES